MRRSILTIGMALVFAGAGAQALELCADAISCALTPEQLAAGRWPPVAPIQVRADIVSDREYWRVPGELEIFDAPHGEHISTTGEGFSFVTVSQILGEWVQIGEDEWVRRDALEEEVKASHFAGVQLPPEGLRHPMAWTLRHLRPARQPGGEPSPLNPFLYRYTRVNIFNCVRIDGQCWYQIGPQQWIHQYRIAMHQPVARPAEIETVKWLGIDLYEQVLTAYEGERAVFTTLISSGLGEWPTNEGVFRVWLRRARAPMSGAFQQPDFYYLQDVPWTQYFDGSIALHGAYWHDGFGFRRSHGCVNASLADSHWLYNWSNDSWDFGTGQGISVYVYSTGEYIF